MRRFTALVAILVAGAAMFGVDQLTKGLLPTLHTTNRMPVELMSAAVLVVLLVGSIQETYTQKMLTGLLIGAALGNLFDILVFGEVRDIFLAGPIVFNVADVGIVVSLTFLLLLLFKSKRYTG